MIFSLPTTFGEGVIISWFNILIPEAPLESGTGGDCIWIFSLCKFDCAVIPGFYYSYTYINLMKLGGWSDYNLALEVIVFEYFHLCKFDSAVIPGFYYSYTYINPMKLGGWSDYI